jgi:low affinity Fe/Cu permease
MTGPAEVSGRRVRGIGWGVGTRSGPARPPHPLAGTGTRWAAATTSAAGSAWALVGAAAVVAVWALTGPAFGFSDAWQLTINTLTTVVTFLMVFAIQNTQNRQERALQVKLDEVLRAVEGANAALAGVEDLPERRIKELQDEVREAAAHVATEEAHATVDEVVDEKLGASRR